MSIAESDDEEKMIISINFNIKERTNETALTTFIRKLQRMKISILPNQIEGREQNSCQLTRTYTLIVYYLLKYDMNVITHLELDVIISLLYNNSYSRFKIVKTIQKCLQFCNIRELTNKINYEEIEYVDGNIILKMFENNIISLSLILKNDFDGFPTHHFIITRDVLNGDAKLTLYSSWLSGDVEIRFDCISLEFVMIETNVFRISYRELLTKMLDFNNLILAKDIESLDEPRMRVNLEYKINQMLDNTYVISLVGLTNHFESIIGPLIRKKNKYI